jgi:D-tagatose-1,6-bisphosphate aldolase subunit GatZ/KbaZ
MAELTTVGDLRGLLRSWPEEGRGIWSACTGHPTVLEAAAAQAVEDGTALLVESTCNQVNPEGGYTGQRPADFASYARAIARSAGLPAERLVLGGDHLGPHPYRAQPAEQAMARARVLVRQCVLAGYAKLHLDASMRLAGDPGAPEAPLDAAIATERTAELCAAAEQAHAEAAGGSPPPLYVIGTDVPAPGGEVGEAAAPAATTAAEAERTVALAWDAFAKCGLESAWERVVAVVLQPGIDFTSTRVFEYQRARAAPLRELALRLPGLVFEAHSTDYQRPASLRALVADGFAVLKVGPALTFAFREAAFGLEAIEREWLGGRRGIVASGLRDALEAAMAAEPAHWRGHHAAGDEATRALRAFGFSDRVRYYWPSPAVRAALERLVANLRRSPPPLPLLSQYLPRQYEAVRAGALSGTPEALLSHAIREVTRAYARACAPGS